MVIIILLGMKLHEKHLKQLRSNIIEIEKDPGNYVEETLK